MKYQKPKVGETWSYKDSYPFKIIKWLNKEEFQDHIGSVWLWIGGTAEYFSIHEEIRTSEAYEDLKISKSNSEFNCKCPRCGEPAYQGFIKIECSNKSCG